jgi:hypothetical protein
MPEYVWSGVGLTVPDGWEPVTLERDAMLLGDGVRPLCELKWRRVVGTFSFDRHLKRLAREYRDADVRAVAEDEPPEAWTAALERLGRSGLRSRSFIWRTGGHRGIGAALHNPATGLAALVQFFVVDEEDGQAAEVLETFRDHTGGKTVPFAMFGLRGRVPAGFALETFSFRPGHYSVRYWRPRKPDNATRQPAGKGAGTRLTFERFAPASVLLKGQTLDGWAAGNLSDPPPKGMPVVPDDRGFHWSGVSGASWLRRLLRRENRARGAVWTSPTANSILAVTATGIVPLADADYTPVVESYELV